MAMIFKADRDTLRRALGEVTTLWGGMYQLMLAPGDLDELSRTATGFGVDVLWAMDRDPISEAAAGLEGYQWQRRIDDGPLSAPSEFLNSRLLGPGFLFEEPGRVEWVLPSWDADDPLSNLFAMWFGSYSDDDYSSDLQRQFRSLAYNWDIESLEALPAAAGEWITPLSASAGHIEYCGNSPGVGFVVVDPQTPVDLLLFWNLRACGAKVFPWPVGHESRIYSAAEHWLESGLEGGDFSGWRSGDGKPVAPRVPCWHRDESANLPDVLHELIVQRGAVPRAWPAHFQPGWNGHHPFSTDIKETFNLALSGGDRRIAIPIPRVDARREAQGRIVAAQIIFHRIISPRPDWTFLAPNVRTLTAHMMQYHDFDPACKLHRPTADGRVVVTSTGAEAVEIAAVPTLATFDKLLESPGWRSSQADAGVFSTRLIERLGGIHSGIASQPGARAALVEVARAPDGKTSAAIVSRIRGNRGHWPNRLANSEAVSEYPAHVFQYLLSRGIIRPLLPVSCPHCTATTAWRPDDLGTQMKCEMCLHEFPLGLALGMRRDGKNEWLYGLAGHVGEAKLTETLSVMATLTVLGASRMGDPLAFPYVLGWTVKGPRLDCEVDIVASFHHRGSPIIVVGEVKSYRDCISQQDLENLQRIQAHLRSKSIECLMLVAVMRALNDDEVALLRRFASHAPPAIGVGSLLVPVLPLVLTGPDLSAAQFDENHPVCWQRNDGMVGLAQESCRRNLGLTTVEPRSDHQDHYFDLSWRTR